MDSNSDESESDTVTAEEEKGHEEAETEPLLQQECASSHTYYTECFSAQATHSLSSPSASGGGGGSDGEEQSRPLQKAVHMEHCCHYRWQTALWCCT